MENTMTPVHPGKEQREQTAPTTTRPSSPELAAELGRLKHEEQVEADRRRQAELARLRDVQAYD